MNPNNPQAEQQIPTYAEHTEMPLSPWLGIEDDLTARSRAWLVVAARCDVARR